MVAPLDTSSFQSFWLSSQPQAARSACVAQASTLPYISLIVLHQNEQAVNESNMIRSGAPLAPWISPTAVPANSNASFMLCLLYTSDAADDLTRVDLGG